MQTGVAHELQGAGSPGSIHFAEGFVEEGQTDGVGGAGLVEAVSLGKRCGHSDVKGRCSFAARFFGIDLAQQGPVAVGVMDADVVLQVGAVILQFTQFSRQAIACLVVKGQALKQQIPGLLVFLTKIRVRRARRQARFGCP